MFKISKKSCGLKCISSPIFLKSLAQRLYCTYLIFGWHRECKSVSEICHLSMTSLCHQRWYNFFISYMDAHKITWLFFLSSLLQLKGRTGHCFQENFRFWRCDGIKLSFFNTAEEDYLICQSFFGNPSVHEPGQNSPCEPYFS